MSFDKGMHPAEIAEKLNALEIRTIKNNPWTGESVKNILRNEKYCGDVLMQKTYTVDCLTHKTKKNEGEVEQYFIPDHHPAIVEREIWDKAQVRLEQIAGKRRRITHHSIPSINTPIKALYNPSSPHPEERIWAGRTPRR